MPRIRPLRLEDAGALAEALRRNRDHLAPTGPPREESFWTDEGQRDLVARHLEHEPTWLAWEVGAVVGRVTLSNVVRGPMQSCSAGYWVDVAHQRQGVATGLVACAVEGAAELGLHRVEAGTLADNAASQRVLERNGFARLGLAERYLFIDGAWRDHVLFQRVLHDDPPETPLGS